MASTIESRLKNSPDALARIVEARHHDPFAVLGKHEVGDCEIVRAFIPGASDVVIVEGRLPMNRLDGTDFFEWSGAKGLIPNRYRLAWSEGGVKHERYDPFCFPPQLSDFDLHLFAEGRHWHAYRFLGAHQHNADGVAGVLFSVWAPNSER
ncbi:MAG: 1,4-alpha-glucan branching enzyme, partial [Gammaproteobacteria bacterium]